MCRRKTFFTHAAASAFASRRRRGWKLAELWRGVVAEGILLTVWRL